MIDVFFTRIMVELLPSVYNKYLGKIPLFLQEKNLRFRKWNDRHANLFGKLLLIEALQKYGYDADCLSHLTFNQYNRPFLFPEIDFNISHSGELVVCAIAKGIRLGIDVEEIKPVDFEHFRDVMTPEQWGIINASVVPFNTFFSFWAIKESVIKADSRGMSIPLTSIHVQDNIVNYENKRWYLTPLHLDDNYSCFLAANSENEVVKLHYKEYLG
jgi:4'-phosphopantetheinyl transferase